MKLPDTSDTITALATPPGAGALAVIRISGPEAFNTVSGFLSPAPVKPAPGQARLLSVIRDGRLVDRVVAVFFRGPASYTGEDTVEITSHGSPYIIRTILNLAVSNGARPAGPGEFTLRAFINGKLDLAQAEGVGHLIEASSEGAHRAAITQAEGELSRAVRAIRTGLVSLLSEIEVRLDDSYEELSPLNTKDFLLRAGEARETALSLAGKYAAGRGIRDGIKIVIAGAPNSGKSSLLNALLGYDRAMVSRNSGTTRDTLEARLEVDGFSVIFTDTAGLSDRAASPLEREGMKRAESAIARADTVLLVKDSSIQKSPGDVRAEKEAARLAPKGAKVLLVYNKSDLPAKRKAAAGAIKVSAKSGQGLSRLRTALVDEQKKIFSDGSQAVVTSARHFASLSAAAAELGKLETVMRAKPPAFELAAEHLRGAADAMSAILGETAPEEVLADIFSKFCIGK